MPNSKYIKILIDGRQVDPESITDTPISISYKLEDPGNFQSKKSSESFNIKLPTTVNNDQIANTFHNPDTEDLTPGETYRSMRNGLIEANGHELLVGKAQLISARYNRTPVDYEFNFYGNNGDWIIPLKEATLFDFLKHITFTFSKAQIVASWGYDGTSEALPFVFAPVRYGQPMDPLDSIPDYNMLPGYMKPSLSVYWLLYWGFKSIGYKISSDFFDTAYFRRLVMPWTWGNFLFSEGTRLDNLKFLAKGSAAGVVWNIDYNDYLDCHVDNEATTGAFDNNGVYEYDAPNKTMKWTYLPALPYGPLDATFEFEALIDVTVTANSQADARIEWYKNGLLFKSEELVNIDAPTVGRNDFFETVTRFATVRVEATDVISAKIFVHTFDSNLGRANISITVDAFKLAYFTIPVGATINFENYNAFKKHKFLDFLKGVLDCFNISPQTDSINKIVTMEPMHPYSLVLDQSVKTGGYFNGNFIDWNEKQDISQTSEVFLFSDAEREFLFRFKDDSKDGILKKVQDRNAVQLASAKYVFPDRFKAGVKEYENTFFSPVMHYRVEQWSNLPSAGTVPQMVCMVPENISNTSRDEAQNTFASKLCWYKGSQDNMDWVFDGEERTDFPFMFAVNYLEGGAEDPVLSYCDEYAHHPDHGYLPVPGLLRRFFLQRLAIMRNGQYHDTYFRLKNNDISNWLHREHISLRGQKWELVEIHDYKPLKEESTKCFLRKWSPVTAKDFESVFPSTQSVAGSMQANRFDLKYNNLICLSSDIP